MTTSLMRRRYRWVERQSEGAPTGPEETAPCVVQVGGGACGHAGFSHKEGYCHPCVMAGNPLGYHDYTPPEDEFPEPLRERIERLARALAVSAHGAGREGMPAPPRDSIDRIVSAIDRLVAEEMSKAARLANAAEAYGRTYPEDEAIGREFWSALTAYREAQR